MELFIATGSAHKLAELGPALPGNILRIPAEAGINGFEVEEDGSTFLENALKKARAPLNSSESPPSPTTLGLPFGPLAALPASSRPDTDRRKEGLGWRPPNETPFFSRICPRGRTGLAPSSAASC